MRKVLAVLLLGLILTLPASAIDLLTNGVVDIISGITITQTSALNFGVVVLNNGTLTVAAADGSTTDPAHLVYDATNISQGIFQIECHAGVDLTATCTVGAIPAGLTLDAFTVDWADLGADSEVLEVGADLTVDRTVTATTNGTPADLPYTLVVTYQ